MSLIVPEEILVNILISLDDESLENAAESGSRWRDLTHRDSLWKKVADRIGYVPVNSSPLFRQLAVYIEQGRQRINEIPKQNLPPYIKQLQQQLPTAENIKMLLAWVEARDILVVWESLAFACKVSDYPNLNACISVQDMVSKAKGFSDWIAANQSSFQKLLSLDLSNNCLTRLPDEIGNFPKLRFLFLQNNKLNTLPDWIARIKNLQFLVLRHNKLTMLPEWIGEFQCLERLDLCSNRLTCLPDEIVNLTRLRKFYLSNNRLVKLPHDIGKLQNLKGLDLCDNRLILLPEGIGSLKKLRWLDLFDNPLARLPDWIGKLKKNKVRLYTNFIPNSNSCEKIYLI